jgi:hypothetical protein
MNDDIQKSPIDVLNKAFAPKQGELANKLSDAGYEHPQSAAIIEGAKRIMGYSAVGQELLNFAEQKELKIKVLTDNKQSGYIPSADIAVVTCPASQKKVYPETVLNLIRVIREAQQEDMGYSRPSPKLSEEEYVKKDMEKQEDIHVIQFHVAYELWKNMDIEDLLNEIRKGGNEQYVSEFINHMETISE